MAAALALVPVTAFAQSVSDPPHVGTLEAAAGVVWNAGYDAGRTQATETRNPSVGSSPFTLFEADARLRAVNGIQALADVYLGPHVAVEADAQFSRPLFAIRLANDAEAATPATATERMTQYLIGASVLYHFQGSDRLVPFVGVGGAYLRQLHTGGRAVEMGSDIHASGGIKWWLGHGPRPLGLRAEVRASSRDGSAALTPHRFLLAELRAGLMYRF
jgi:opacity protein-like surface antigen